MTFFTTPMSFCPSHYHCNICGLNRTRKIELDQNNADVQIKNMKIEEQIISLAACSISFNI